jgi:parallel beta-helix repeat protein
MRRILLSFFIFPQLLVSQTPEIYLTKGLIIKESCRVKPSVYALSGDTADVFSPSTFKLSNLQTFKPIITISGENLVVDFQNAELNGAAPGQLPNSFYGVGIFIRGKNITLKNARARGYKVALLAEGAANLTLEGCDFSYNYRPRLRSIREREDFSDWLSYHHNENDEWLRYGAGIYLKNCAGATVRSCRITGNQNALLMTGCTDGLIYNNAFQFNSGLGVGLYRSSRNRVMHNRLDWNVRGYSHGFYQRGQDSAGILVYEQSNDNLIAFNSATHSGDGLFLWAGQTTMDSGEGGCNDNWIFGNDFSYAPTNGVEVTFSRNRIQGNLIRNCTYGIWGGYSFESKFFANMIIGCRTAIAIEHGQNDTILQNLIQDDTVGIQLWARETQPSDWGYARKRDTRSRDILLDRNVFLNTRKPLKISASQNIIVNGENLFWDFEKLFEVAKPNENFKFIRNQIYGTNEKLAEVWRVPELSASKSLNFSYARKPENPYEPLNMLWGEVAEPDSLPDGMPAALPKGFPRGREFIIIGEWGPFDFRRPIAALDTILKTADGHDVYSLALIGPSGDWKIAGMTGVATMSEAAGTVPQVMSVKRDPKSDFVRVEFEYTSPQTITTELGEKIPAGQPFKFDFQRFEKKFDWRIRFFNYDDASDPLKNDSLFSEIKKQNPAAEKKTGELAFAWWGAPEKGVNEDKFATVSDTKFYVEPGEYIFELTSDDGTRLYLDGKRLIDNWDIHEPETDEITVRLGGHHLLRIEHFDAGGFATLDFRIRPK